MPIATPKRGFSVNEFEQRVDRAQRLMHENKVDVMLLTTEANIRYFTGFFTQFWQSPTRPWFVAVPSQGKPIAIIPEIGVSGMQSTWIDNIISWPSPQPEDDGISLLTTVLQENSKHFNNIGVMMGHESHLRMPLYDFKKLTAALSSKNIVDGSHIMRQLRQIKSNAEIEKIHYVCQLTSDAFNALPAMINCGESERDICKKLRIELLKQGADHSPYLVAGSGQGGYDSIIMGPTDRKLSTGDVLIIDTGTTFDGYFSDFDRNFSFGAPSDLVRRAYDCVYRATDAGFAVAKPGNRTSDIWQAMWSVLEKGGALGNDVGRLGHGLGMQITEGCSNTKTDNTLLETGMVITLEPGMTFAPGKQMVHEENIVITDDGAKMLSKRAAQEITVIT